MRGRENDQNIRSIGLGTGGLMGAEPPQYFDWGAGVSLSPPQKKSYILIKSKIKKGPTIMQI